MPYGKLSPDDRYGSAWQTRAAAQQYVGPGWAALVAECFTICEASGFPFWVDQVKEKFGALRFYVTFGESQRRWGKRESLPWETVEPIFEQLALVEAKSYTVCELCGAPGELDRDRSWWRTVCPTHKAARANPKWDEPNPPAFEPPTSPG